MDLLLSSIKSKKREKEKMKKKITGGKRKRFFRVGEFEKEREKNYLQRTMQEEEAMRAKKKRKFEKPEEEDLEMKDSDANLVEIPREKAMLELREMGEPITLFGETDIERLKRLKYLQTSQFQEEKKVEEEGEVEFEDLLRAEEESAMKLFKTEEEQHYDKERAQEIERIYKSKTLPARKRDESNMEYVLRILLRILRDWEVALIMTPIDLKKRLDYRRDKQIHVQCKEFIQPLFKQLRQQTLTDDILDPLNEIVEFVIQRDYIKANTTFMRLAIGNAPWPMGVTNVGIHARAANEKIRQDQIAHVLNDETQRKYIQSVKRLLTFAKKKYPKDAVITTFF